MAKFIARAVVTLALLYAGAAAVFAFVHYGDKRPDVPTILTDFNAWGKSLFEPAGRPAPREAPPVPPGAVKVEPPSAPPPVPPAPTSEPAPTDPVTRELDRIQHEVLPKVEEMGSRLREMPRGDGVEFDRLRTEGMALLSGVRPYLDGLLEKDPEHKRANRLWTRLQEMFVALKKL